MPTALTTLKRSGPSINHFYLVQRLQIRQLSTPSPSSSSSSSLPLISDAHNNRREMGWSRSRRWIMSGIAAGSGFGLLYWFAASTSDGKSPLSFADWSTESMVTDRRSTSDLGKFSLSNYSSSSRSKFVFGDTYRRKVFFKYEKRIRLRSPPEKVFEYFASHRTGDGEVLMTPADLMRAVVPVFPPFESNLVRDGCLIGERSPGELRCPPSEFFMLFDVNNDGHISFKEYIFFVMLLSIPESSFSVVFKMFDVDNSGKIDKEEFKKVMALMRAQNRQGAAHKNGLRPGMKVHGHVDDGGLVEYFFGKDGKGCLKHDKFVQFLRDLHDEILRLEFAHYDYKLQGTIAAKDFALSIVASADMSHLGRLLDRVDRLHDDAQLRDIHITFEEFKNFAELRKKLQPFSLALFSYGKVNGLLTREDFKRAASHVCGISLSDRIIDIIFHLFDSNRDGSLSPAEFVRVLQKRERDIAQPVESGSMGFLSFWLYCANDHSIGQLSC